MSLANANIIEPLSRSDCSSKFHILFTCKAMPKPSLCLENHHNKLCSIRSISPPDPRIQQFASQSPRTNPQDIWLANPLSSYHVPSISHSSFLGIQRPLPCIFKYQAISPPLPLLISYFGCGILSSFLFNSIPGHLFSTHSLRHSLRPARRLNFEG